MPGINIMQNKELIKFTQMISREKTNTQTIKEEAEWRNEKLGDKLYRVQLSRNKHYLHTGLNSQDEDHKRTLKTEEEYSGGRNLAVRVALQEAEMLISLGSMKYRSLNCGFWPLH